MRRYYHIEEVRDHVAQYPDGTREHYETYHLVYRGESMGRAFHRFETLLIPGHYILECSSPENVSTLATRRNA
jgi:hypothetical protein